MVGSASFSKSSSRGRRSVISSVITATQSSHPALFEHFRRLLQLFEHLLLQILFLLALHQLEHGELIQNGKIRLTLLSLLFGLILSTVVVATDVAGVLLFRRLLMLRNEHGTVLFVHTAIHRIFIINITNTLLLRFLNFIIKVINIIIITAITAIKKVKNHISWER
ncbi:hypothetical protein TYRP_009736 [Tyrophagus putrescentiae]|nr:hypothetical protein TYRP_009736 [Tyrophagus putrescentiae]